MAAVVTTGLAAAAAVALACYLRWRSGRDPRVWTVWAGVGTGAHGGQAVPIGIRKRRHEARVMVELDPAGRVAVDARAWPGVVPPRDVVDPSTVIWGAA